MEIEEKKKLTYNLERTHLDGFICNYQYRFRTTQWLESVDNIEYFGIDHDSYKQKLIDTLVGEFRIALNAAVFGDPAGKDYANYMKEQKQNIPPPTPPEDRFLKEGKEPEKPKNFDKYKL
ncbi:MAG: hypothetical protein WC979_03280 [Candidatus Pacearchaeota archaeon]|jgi:hypothetical protein|nr:hypothetical protein [Clostridia bacterium]